jgi:solute carrier family 35 protein F1/2
MSDLIKNNNDTTSIGQHFDDVAHIDSLEKKSVDEHLTTIDEESNQPSKKKRMFSYFTTKHFWIIFFMGQILSLCITSTNTLTSFLSEGGNSMPAFQSLFNYVLLFLIFMPYTLYRYGFKAYFRLMFKEGWKYFILSFLDVQGNYFIVKAYQYTNMLSAALLDNLSVVWVVILSFLLLKVRYHWTQLLGIVVCIAGVVLIIVSDLLMGKDYHAVDPVKGDLFIILATFCYGASNTLEEFLTSKRPYYEVLSSLGFFGTIIIGVQAAIFERSSIRDAHWSPAVGGYFTGYTLSLLILYLIAPIMFRMSSSAFYNLSLLTSDFWALLIGTQAFGYRVYWLYPVGFVLTIIGVIVYFLVQGNPLGESVKPWLGENQEEGVSGVGTAKKRQQKEETVTTTEVQTGTF